MIAELGGPVAGGLVAYRIGDAPEPLDELPAMFRPLQALENRALGTHYVNVLATYPEFRRRGVATRLLAEAERQGAGGARAEPDRRRPQRAGAAALRGVRLRRGGAEPIVKEGWRTESRTWVLMLKPAAVSREGLQIGRRARYICRWRVLAFP